MVLVNEPGLYRLIMRSNKPEAEAFQDWVTEEVLPSIRKTGRYAAPGGAIYDRITWADGPVFNVAADPSGFFGVNFATSTGYGRSGRPRWRPRPARPRPSRGPRPPRGPAPAVARAMVFLRVALALGSARVSVVRARAAASEPPISAKSLYAAADRLGVETYETQGRKYWRLAAEIEA